MSFHKHRATPIDAVKAAPLSRPLSVRFAVLSRGLVLLLAVLAPSGACRRTRLSRGDAAVVVAVAARPEARPLPSLQEREPNDSPDKAQLIVINPEGPVIDLGGDLLGEASACGKDVDVFKLLIPGANSVQERAGGSPCDSAPPEDVRSTAKRLSLVIGPEGATNTSLQVLNSDLKVLEAVASESGLPTGIPNLAVQPGLAYYFRVRALPKPGGSRESQSPCRYKLSIELGSFEAGDEQEPNGSMDSAEPVAMTGLAELAGFYGWQHDQDFYRLPAPEVSSALEVVVDAVEGVAASLQVLGGDGARLAFAKGRKGEPIALHNVRMGAAAIDGGASGRFAYLTVRSEAGQNLNKRYILHLALGALKQGAEVEPNDAQANATLIRDGETRGYLPSGDVDYFLYQERGRRELTVDAEFPPRVRGKVEVLRAGKLETVGWAEAKKPHQHVVLSKIGYSGEPLLLRLSLAKGEGDANLPYLLRITSIPWSGQGQTP